MVSSHVDGYRKKNERHLNAETDAMNDAITVHTAHNRKSWRECIWMLEIHSLRSIQKFNGLVYLLYYNGGHNESHCSVLLNRNAIYKLLSETTIDWLCYRSLRKE